MKIGAKKKCINDKWPKDHVYKLWGKNVCSGMSTTVNVMYYVMGALWNSRPGSRIQPSRAVDGRRLSTTLPLIPEQLRPQIPHGSAVAEKDGLLKKRQKENHNSHREAKELCALLSGNPVWMDGHQSPKEVRE